MEEQTIQRLVEEVGVEIRQIGAQSVMTSQLIADRFGLHTTDLEGLDLIHLKTQVTAGELAKATGLTSGAATALINRLKRAGFVERIDDPRDRRRVLVRAKAAAIAPIKAVYLPMQKRMFTHWAKYTARELALIIDFLRSSRELSVACAAELANEAPRKSKRLRQRTHNKRV